MAGTWASRASPRYPSPVFKQISTRNRLRRRKRSGLPSMPVTWCPAARSAAAYAAMLDSLSSSANASAGCDPFDGACFFKLWRTATRKRILLDAFLRAEDSGIRERDDPSPFVSAGFSRGEFSVNRRSLEGAGIGEGQVYPAFAGFGIPRSLPRFLHR